MDATEGLQRDMPRAGVAVLIADVAFEVRRLERLCGHDLRLTPALAFWSLYRAESKRADRGIPSEEACVHDALRALVPAGDH